jgi:hypothetical protein
VTSHPSFFSRSKFEILFMALAVGLLIFSARQKVTAEVRRFVAPPPVFRYFHFGYNETMADVFWIRVVQDLAVCDPAESPGQAPPKVCTDSWVFRMLDLITDLAPQFGMPYYYGATNLSVLVNDSKGAKIIFDKGLRAMPDSWDIAYRAAYHYMIELNDKEKAAELLVRAGKLGAPQWVFALAGRLYTEEGKAFLAKSVLLEQLRADPNGLGARRIKERLAEIEAGLVKSKQKSDAK